jgi:hypothetical protein
MTTAGLIVMTLSVGIVTTLFAWCIWKVLAESPAEAEHVRGVELHTPDMDEEAR